MYGVASGPKPVSGVTGAVETKVSALCRDDILAGGDRRDKKLTQAGCQGVSAVKETWSEARGMKRMVVW